MSALGCDFIQHFGEDTDRDRDCKAIWSSSLLENIKRPVFELGGV